MTESNTPAKSKTARRAARVAGSGKRLKVTLIHGLMGWTVRQKRTVWSLGIRRRLQTVLLPDDPAVRGKLRRIEHLLKVEEA